MMIVNWRLGLRKFWIVISLALSGATIPFFERIAQAQITPDGTLGNEASVVTKINELEEQIDGGALRETNLFHSFLEFNIGEGRAAYFSNPAAVQNIFSRVTGSNPSRLLGKLGVLGEANLFFLNPNGIIFGPNASLDLRGSFVASTASSLKFPEGTEFSASNPEAPPLLTVNVKPPVGLLFEGSGEFITNEGNLAAGQDLTLSASNLNLQGQLYAERDLTLSALDTVKMRDSVLTPFIAAAGRQLLVQGNQAVDIFALNHPNSGFFSGGDLVLRSANTVGGDAHYWSGGSFRIEQLDGSLGDLFSPHDPIIRSAGDVSFSNYLGTSLHILAGGSVDIGTVIIGGAETDGTEGTDFIAEEVKLSDGTEVSIDGRERPTFDVRAGLDPKKVGKPGFPTGVIFNFPLFGSLPTITDNAMRADIEIGAIVFADIANLLMTGTISPITGTVLLKNKYEDNSELDGDIQVLAELEDFLSEVPESLSALLPEGLENLAVLMGDVKGGGSLYIDSRGSITLNGLIGTLAIPSNNIINGRGGNLTFLADGDITLNPGTLIGSTGLGGKIVFNSGGTLSLNDGAVATFTNGEEQGGDIIVNASDSVKLIDGTGSVTRDVVTLLDNINLASPELKAQLQRVDGTGLTTAAAGKGDSGDLTITTSELIIRNESEPKEGDFAGVATWSLQDSIGNGGNLKINAHDLVSIVGNKPGDFIPILDPSEIDSILLNIPTGVSTVALGRGAPGNLTIETEQLEIRHGVSVNTSVVNPAAENILENQGNLTVKASQSVELEGEALLLTGTRGSGNAGDLIVKADQGVTLRNGGSIAVDTIASGEAGKLTIETPQLAIRSGSRVSAATSGEGLGGDVTISSNSVEVSGTSASGIVPSGIFTNTQGRKKGGEVKIETSSLSLTDGARIQAQTSGTGAAGNISITATDSIDISGVSPFGLNSGLLTSSETDTSGPGGNIVMNQDNSQGTVRLSKRGFLSARTRSSKDGGNIEVNANKLVMETGGQIITAATINSSGQAGSITVNATESVTIDGTGTPFTPTDDPTIGTSFEGQKVFNLDSLEFSTESNPDVEDSGEGGIPYVSVERTPEQIRSDTTILGAADDTFDYYVFTIGAPDSPDSRGIFDIDNGDRGDIGEDTAGDIDTELFLFNLNTGKLLDDNDDSATISQGAGGSTNRRDSYISNTTLNPGIYVIGVGEYNSSASRDSLISGDTPDAGDTYTLQLSLENNNPNPDDFNPNQGLNSGLFAQTKGIGDAGNVTINTPQLTVQNGAKVSASSISSVGGNITLEDLNTLEVSNGEISASTESGTARNLTLNENGTAANSVLLTGNSTLSVEAKDDGAGQPGNAGSIKLNTEQLTLTGTSATERASISASTTGGESQEIILQNVDELNLTHGEISASTETGQAGSISLNQGENSARSVELSGQDTRISVEATEEEGNAGSVTINTSDLTLKGGRITAETRKSGEQEGANIILQISDLLTLSNESKISAEAFDKAKGGNITIRNDNGFIIAFPPEGPNGSDIIANADRGDGGSIGITTQELFGIEKREGPTRFNDITAKSNFGLEGTVEINTSGIDPTRGLNNLPEETVESEVAEGCQVQVTEPAVEFYDLGRGGLPLRIDEALNVEVLIVPLIPFDVEEEDKTVQPWDKIFSISEMKGKFSLTPACRNK